MKVYFDQNAWHCLMEKFTPSAINQEFKEKNLEVCLGINNIYEFGRCFLEENDLAKIESGKEVFQYLRDVDISYFVKMTGQLVELDLDYARTGGRILPYLDWDDIIRTKEEICRLACGFYEKSANFVNQRENGLAKSTPQYRNAVIQANLKMRKPRNFEELKNDWTNRRQILDGSEYAEKSRYLSDSLLFSNSEKYPYLNTYINAQIHFNFIALSESAGPSKKRTSDYRHLINANAADCFVTEDKDLQKTSKKICPYIKVYSWSEFQDKFIN